MPARWHRELPWREFMRLWRWLRRTFFTAKRPEGTHLYVSPETTGANPERFILRAIGRRGFGPGHRFSYDKGEDVNLRNVYRNAAREDGLEWWQDHLRAWIDADGGVWVSAHVEPSPEDHPKAHLDGVGASRADGLDEVAAYLDAAGVEYDRREWSNE